MATFQQRKDPMRLMWRRLIAVLLLVCIAIALRGVWGVYKKSQESRVLKIEAEATLNDLKSREKELREDIASLKSDRGVEAELRERYDLAKEGESVVVIVDPPAPPPEPKPTPFQRFKSWFSW
jgi:cell division protein FtsB